MTDRARINVADVIVVAAVSIVTIGLAPVFSDLAAMLADDADPLSQMLLQLILPFLFLGIVVSAGVSARRRV